MEPPSYLVRFLVLLALPGPSSSYILRLPCKLEGQFIKSRTRMRVTSSDSGLLENRSPRACIMECLKSNTCKTINHNAANMSCELSKLNATDGGASVTSSESWVHYSTIWNRTKIGTNCLTKSRCIMNNTVVCRDVCSTRGYRCFCKDRFMGNYCELYAANDRVKVNEEPRSCLHLKQLAPEADSGYYYVRWKSSNKKVYCDMKTGGGGWMMIGNLTRKTWRYNNIRYMWGINYLSTFEDGASVFSTGGLKEIFDQVGFREMRFFCRFNSPASNTVHIKVTSLEVIRYLTGQEFSRPYCQGTFISLPDDTSNLSRGCTKSNLWNEKKWSSTDTPRQSRLHARLVLCDHCSEYRSFDFDTVNNRYACDYGMWEGFDNVSGVWQYHIR